MTLIEDHEVQVSLTFFSWSSDFALYLEALSESKWFCLISLRVFHVRLTFFPKMSQYEPVWPQNNVGHSDIHFMVQRECCWPDGSNTQPPDYQLDVHPNEPPRPAGWLWPGVYIYVSHWVLYLVILISSNSEILKGHSQDKIWANDIYKKIYGQIYRNFNALHCMVVFKFDP